MKQLHLILAIILILSSCKKEQQIPITHYKTKFVHELNGTTLKGAQIEVQKLVAVSGCGGWGCGNKLQYWGQLVTDDKGYIDIRENGMFQYKPVEDSLWNPLPAQNPMLPQTPTLEVDETCYLIPVTQLSLTAQKGRFQSATVQVDIPAGLPHFAANISIDAAELSSSTAQETLVHLLRRGENQVKVTVHFADLTTRDTVITIVPTTGDKIRMTLPY